MATTASASRLQFFTVSTAVGSTHGVPAFNRATGDLAVIYSQGPGEPQTVKCAIFKRVADVNGKARYIKSQVLTLGSPAAAVTPTGNANPSCAHPWIVAIKDGFACFWERRDTVVAQTAMTAGGMQIEMAKLIADPNGGGGYVIRASATLGKGYVLDNTVIAGVAGGTPRAAALDPTGSNIVGLVYGHQLTHSLVGDDNQRTYDVRAAYLDFSADGKPSFISGGNRTGGSAVGEADDGGFAAGPTQTYLVNAVNLDDDNDTPIFSAGGGLPSCIFDMRGDFAVAYEARQDKDGAGGKAIFLRIFKGPFRSSGLDSASIYFNSTDFAVATAGHAARRPMMAFRNVRETGLALSGANYPPILIAYGDQTPGAADSTIVVVKTITFPLNGAAPTVAALTVPVNTNYDATAEEQTLPTCVDSPFLSAALMDEKLVNAAGGEGHKFKVVHADGTGEILFLPGTQYPVRPNMQAVTLPDGTKLAALVYEGPAAAAASTEEVFVQLWQFP